MSLSVVYCSECGEGCFARNGVLATLRWAEHFQTVHLPVYLAEEASLSVERAAV